MEEKNKFYFASDFHLGSPNYEKSLEREKKICAWLDSIKSSANENVTYFTTEPLNRTNKTSGGNLNSFWDRVSHAKRTLDDFGSIKKGGNG